MKTVRLTEMSFAFFIFLISYSVFQLVSHASTTHTVLILHHSFEPESVYVQPGDTVRWLHQDVAAHTVTGNGTEKWNSEHMEWGDAYLRVFENTGAHDYVCNYHPMDGKVEGLCGGV
jgi:plastocyanin